MNNDCNEKYIVPIYKGTIEEQCFWGTGFVIANYLISAAHIFNDNYDYWILYDGRFIKLTNLIYRELEKGNIARKDLQIYELEIDTIRSPYTLFTKEYNWPSSFILKGFSFNEESKVIDKDIIEVKAREHAYEYPVEINQKNIKLLNCFNIFPKGKYGNSGCPIMKGKIVYGMNISGFEGHDYYGGNVLRSDYISIILDDFK